MFMMTTPENDGRGRNEKIYRRKEEARNRLRLATISPWMLMNLALNESIPRPCGDLEITLMDTLATLSREMATTTMRLCRPQDFSPEKFYHDGKLSPYLNQILK